MRLATNFYFWSAAAWTIVLASYSLNFSRLNSPLVPELRVFLVTAIIVSFTLAALHSFRSPPTPALLRDADTRPWFRKWSGTFLFTLGFALDFAYQGRVPILSGEYRGFDVEAPIQQTVGIPIVHVFLIAGSIFYAISLADRFAGTRQRMYILQFFLIVTLLFLNNSRGYIAFCVFGAILVILAARPRSARFRGVRVIGVLLIAYCLVIGVGLFGNFRSTGDWFDTSFINRIGLYNEGFPTFFSEDLKWMYTYLTSPLANLNFNVERFEPTGDAQNLLLAFVPETFSKYAVAEQLTVAYQVDYLNASTGYISAYYLGGGVSGLYASFALQVLLLELGLILARRTRVAYNLYTACAAIILVSFVFYNSFSTSATAFLLLFAVISGWHRARNIPSSAAAMQPRTSARRYQVPLPVTARHRRDFRE